MSIALGDVVRDNHGREGVVVREGAYSPVRKVNSGGEVHHMPMKSALKAAEHPLGAGSKAGKGPSIHMEKPDHRALDSSSGKGGALRDAQAAAIKDGRFDDAVEMGIDEVRARHGTKYDDAILEMIDNLPDDR